MYSDQSNPIYLPNHHGNQHGVHNRLGTTLQRSNSSSSNTDSNTDSGTNSLSGSPKLNEKQSALVQDFQKNGVPLHSAWTLYVDKIPTPGASLEEYEDNLRKIYTVNTIEGFWQVFNNIPAPSRLYNRYSFHLGWWGKAFSKIFIFEEIFFSKISPHALPI